MIVFFSLSVIVVIVENQWTPESSHHHTTSKTQSSNLTEEDCWMIEDFTPLEECQPCSGNKNRLNLFIF